MKNLSLNGFAWVPFFGTVLVNLVEKPQHTLFATVFIVVLFAFSLGKVYLSFPDSDE